MSILRSRDCIHSSRSGHSSSRPRNRADRPCHRCSEGVCRVVDRWLACIFAANHAKRRLVLARRIDCGDWSLARVRGRRAVRLDLAGVRDIARAPFGRSEGNAGYPFNPGELHEETK
jgi:hypothetical protein